tara:strand:- start:127 stop:684 length:558 start_codon:yes stop_codon:yes gene_type:complete
MLTPHTTNASREAVEFADLQADTSGTVQSFCSLIESAGWMAEELGAFSWLAGITQARDSAKPGKVSLVRSTLAKHRALPGFLRRKLTEFESEFTREFTEEVTDRHLIDRSGIHSTIKYVTYSRSPAPASLFTSFLRQDPATLVGISFIRSAEIGDFPEKAIEKVKGYMESIASNSSTDSISALSN